MLCGPRSWKTGKLPLQDYSCAHSRRRKKGKPSGFRLRFHQELAPLLSSCGALNSGFKSHDKWCHQNTYKTGLWRIKRDRSVKRLGYCFAPKRHSKDGSYSNWWDGEKWIDSRSTGQATLHSDGLNLPTAWLFHLLQNTKKCCFSQSQVGCWTFNQQFWDRKPTVGLIVKLLNTKNFRQFRWHFLPQPRCF